MLILSLAVVSFFLGICLKVWIKEPDRIIKYVTAIIANCILPIIIICAVSDMTLGHHFYQMSLSAILLTLFFIVLTYIVIKFLKLPNSLSGALIISLPTFEGGSIGYALVLILLSRSALMSFFIFDITIALILFTIIYAISNLYGKHYSKPQHMIKKVLLGPVPISILIGIAININGGFPLIIYNYQSYLGTALLIMIVLFIGYSFIIRKKIIVFVVILSIVKVSLGFSLAFTLSYIFKLDKASLFALTVGCMLPPSFLIVIFAEINGLDQKFIATFISICSVISVVSIYIILHFNLV